MKATKQPRPRIVDLAKEVPDEVVALIGQRVERVWAVGNMLVVFFTNGMALKAVGVPAIGFAAFSLAIGKAHDSWRALDLFEPDRQARALHGRLFTGLDGKVLDFDGYGACIEANEIRWVRRRESL